jgi:hypothetical protein
VSAGYNHTCGVTSENRVYCWGFNFDGELGDGTGYPTNIERLTPVPVAVARRFIQVWAGKDYTCAIEDETQGPSAGATIFWGSSVAAAHWRARSQFASAVGSTSVSSVPGSSTPVASRRMIGLSAGG